MPGKLNPEDLAEEVLWETSHHQQYRHSLPRPPPRDDAGSNRGPPISLAGHCLGMDELAHTFIMGASGAGKTTLMGPTFGSLVRAVTGDPTRKLLIVASKEECLEWLVGMGVPFRLVTFTYSQGHSWDISRDFNSEFFLTQLAKYWFPDLKGDNAFWRTGARALFTAATISIRALIGRCGFPEMINIGHLNDASFVNLLKQSEIGRVIADTYLADRDQKLVSNLRAEVASMLQGYWVPAAKAEISSPFSLEEFYFGRSLPPIALIQVNRSIPEVERPIALSMFRRALQLMTSAPLTSRKDKVLFVDDFNFLGNIPELLTASELARGSGTVLMLCCQSFEGIQDAFGPKRAEAMFTSFPIQILLGANSEGSASWSAKSFGVQERIEDTFSRSFGGERVQGREDKRRSIEQVVKSGDIHALRSPSPARGFTFYMRSPQFGHELAKHVPWDQVMWRTPPRGKYPLTVIPRRFQRPTIWTDTEMATLITTGPPSQLNYDLHSPTVYSDNMAIVEEEIKKCLLDFLEVAGAHALESLGHDALADLKKLRSNH